MQEMNGESTITITPLVVPDAVVIIVMMIGVSLTILTQWPFQKNDNKQPFLFDCEWLMFFSYSVVILMNAGIAVVGTIVS
jgi:hypothetical protein